MHAHIKAICKTIHHKISMNHIFHIIYGRVCRHSPSCGISKRFVMAFHMKSESNDDLECGVLTGYVSLVLLKPKSMTWAFSVEF